MSQHPEVDVSEDIVAGPRARHRERLAVRAAELRVLERRDTVFSRARVGCFVAFLGLVIAGWLLRLTWLWLLLPVVIFIVLVVLHERVIVARDAGRRAVAHHEAALERLAGRWAGQGVTATDYVGDDHPYAADLDLFGVGSLFDLLCRARTRAGEERLAAWMTCHVEARVDVRVIRARQASVRAMIDAVELREDLAVLGEAARLEIRPAALIGWGRSGSVFSPSTSARLRVAALVVPVLVVAGCVLWAVGAGPYLLIGAGLLAGIIQRALRDDLARISGPIDRFSHELSVLAAVLARLEATDFDDPRLIELREALRGSAAIARLRRLAGWYEAQRNGLFAAFAVLLMWGPNFALAIERWRAEHGPRIATWIDALGEFEALSSIACHAFEQPDAVFPELLADDEAPGGDGPLIDGEALGHPLLDRAVCVANDVHLVAPVRVLVVSGSNMSGKSTYLRTVGCNVILALLGAPVRARSMRLTSVHVGATLRVQDSLREGASRFWAELTRLRRISELAAAGPTLFLLDEIFHGTNSHDRRIGAEALVRSLIERGAIGLLTTHDLALAEAAHALAPAAVNVHFQDELVDGAWRFDYRMRDGVVRRSNALELMRSVGLDV